jgi:hypothetical protein
MNQIRISLKGHMQGQQFLQSELYARIANGAAVREQARQQAAEREAERRIILSRLKEA